MYVNLQDLSLTIAAISVVLCPTLCAMMAYRISREYAGKGEARSA